MGERYLFLELFDLLLEAFVFLLGRLVLLLQLGPVRLAPAAQHPLQELHRVAWLLRLLVELHQNLGELVDCPRLLQVLLELLLLRLHAALLHLRVTCDIIIFINCWEYSPN